MRYVKKHASMDLEQLVSAVWKVYDEVESDELYSVDEWMEILTEITDKMGISVDDEMEIVDQVIALLEDDGRVKTARTRKRYVGKHMKRAYVEVTDIDFDYLYNQSALTWEGMSSDPANLRAIYDAFIEIGAEPKDDLRFYEISGREMNEHYGLTGSNAYPDDLTILSIPLDDFGNGTPLIMWRFNVGARWFDDVVDNNAMREGARKNTAKKASGDVWDLFYFLREVLGDETLVTNMAEYFSTDVLRECLLDIARTWDVDMDSYFTAGRKASRRPVGRRGRFVASDKKQRRH